MAHARTHLHIHNAQVAACEREGTFWLKIPAPRVEGDESDVTAFLTGREALRQLRDDINAVLGEVVEP